MENYTDNWKKYQSNHFFILLKKAQAVVQKTSRKNVTSCVVYNYTTSGCVDL